MRPTTTTLLGSIAIGFGCMSAQTQALADSPANQFWNGEKQYQVHCSSCHGNWGQGIGIFGPPLKGDPFVTSAPANIVAQTVIDGRQGPYKHFKAYSGMPEFNYLDVGEVDAIVDYLKNGLQTAPPNTYPPHSPS
ncbi:MAG TPA: cytochrome c [Usitatibacter sp.]|nr:cytochrome c [Usitatibacter sp.]